MNEKSVSLIILLCILVGGIAGLGGYYIARQTPYREKCKEQVGQLYNGNGFFSNAQDDEAKRRAAVEQCIIKYPN